TVTDEPAVHRIVAPGHGLEQFPIAGRRNRIAAERTPRADRGGHIIVPVACPEAGGLVRINAGRAEVDEVAGEGGFELPLPEPAEVDPCRAPHDPQVVAAGELL